ncbi:CRAL-TRIO domain-containing protein [Poronia punctata]|nr:CRAL-TRIO domain-containing protein [Poronia punctata]
MSTVASDTTYLTTTRFFAARSGDPQAAFEQFKEAVGIRKSANHIPIYANIDISDYEATRKLYPHWSGYRDKRGLPICMFDIAALNGATMADYKKTRGMPLATGDLSTSPNSVQRAITFHETLTRFVLPLCTAMQDRPDPHIPVSSAVYLVDVSSFGLKQAFDLRNYAQDISKLLATSFPEVVDTVYVLNAPAYFGKIWNLLKKWVDPRTAEKLVILTKSEVLPRLTASIDLEAIPQEHGGEFEFQHGMVARLDPGICRQLEWLWQSPGTIPPGPVKWVVDGEGRRMAVAVGSISGEPRFQPLAVLPTREFQIPASA